MKSTYQSSRTDRGGGFGVPIGEIVLGSNYTEAQYNAKKSEIQSEYFNQVNASREIDIALMSGDDAILEAWTDCMRAKGGGITARFDPVSPTEVFMHVEYFNQGPVNQDRLREDVVLPAGVTVVAGRDCLKKKNAMTTACRVSHC